MQAVPEPGGSGSTRTRPVPKKFNKLNQNQSQSESEARHTVLQTANEEPDGEIPNDEERVPYSSAGPSNGLNDPQTLQGQGLPRLTMVLIDVWLREMPVFSISHILHT
jgi:hypothetical protein